MYNSSLVPASGSRRIEGGFTIHHIDIASISFDEIGAVFGIGEYTGNTIAYIGVSASGTFKGYGVGVQFLSAHSVPIRRYSKHNIVIC
jgi:hypothetical protein